MLGVSRSTTIPEQIMPQFQTGLSRADRLDPTVERFCNNVRQTRIGRCEGQTQVFVTLSQSRQIFLRCIMILKVKCVIIHFAYVLRMDITWHQVDESDHCKATLKDKFRGFIINDCSLCVSSSFPGCIVTTKWEHVCSPLKVSRYVHKQGLTTVIRSS